MRVAAIWVASTLCLCVLGCGNGRDPGPGPLMMVGTTAPCIDPMTGMTRGNYELWCDASATTCEFRIDGNPVSTCTGGATSQSCVDAAMAAADACVHGTGGDGGSGGHDGGPMSRDSGPAG